MAAFFARIQNVEVFGPSELRLTRRIYEISNKEKKNPIEENRSSERLAPRNSVFALVRSAVQPDGTKNGTLIAQDVMSTRMLSPVRSII
jgi:hypothetical protein